MEVETITPKFMVTTFDNPYSPFTEFTDWLNYDVTHGYRTSDRVDRIYTMLKYSRRSTNLEPVVDDEIYEEAQHRLVEADPLNLFRLVTRDSIDEKNGELNELKNAVKEREVDREQAAVPYGREHKATND